MAEEEPDTAADVAGDTAAAEPNQNDDDFADELVYFKNNPNVTMCQGRWGQIKKMRHTTCIGRFLSQPQGTMHNGYYVEI